MRGYIWAFLFISLTYMSTKSDIDRIGDPSRMWTIIKKFESSLEFCSRILQRYSIWIFHCTVYTLLFATELTYVSILLCFMELIIFPIQLYGWLRTKEKRDTMIDDENKKPWVKEQIYITIERSWRYLFNIIILNAVYKYLTFFARYVTVRHGFVAFFNLFMSKKFMVFLMDWNNTSVDALQNDFFFEAVLLIMGFYTNKCVIANATKEMMDSSSGLVSLGENLVELAEIAEKNDISEYRHTTTFTTMLLILKGFTFLFIGFHTMNNTNAFKVLLLLLPLIYYNVLFVKINKSIDLYKIRSMITNYLVYFFKNFASNVKLPDQKNTPGALPDLPSSLSRDVLHYEAYFSQFLKQMENDIVTLSEKFWPYFFYLWLTYSLILIVIRILLQYGAELSLFFRYFGLFYSNNLQSTPSAQEKNRILQNEQLGNQVIFAFLIVEFLVIHYYLSLPMNIEPMADIKVKQMVDMMESKFKLYTTTEKDIRKKLDQMDEEGDENDEDQPFKEPFSRVDRSKSITMHFNHLKEQYAEDVMMLEGTTHMEREEMTRFIRVRKNATEEIPFRGLKFCNEPQKPDLLISESELKGRFVKQPAVSKDDVIPEENEEHEEYRPRGVTGFVVNTKSVVENLQLIKPKLDASGNDPKIVGLVVKHFMLVEEDNEQDYKDLDDQSFKEEGFKELYKKDEEKEQEKHILIYMDQETSTQIKVLYKERNTHMFHLGRLLNSLSYVTGRLMILPLLYSLGDKTAVNIFILFVTATYIFRFNVGSFEKQMKIYMPIFTVVIFVESLLQYLASIEPLKNQLRTFVGCDSSSQVTKFHSSFYRLWLIAIACIGYASIIWTAKFIFAHLFVIRQRVADIFFTYSLEDCKIDVDFMRWKHYQWILTTLMSNEVYAQLNDIYITCTIIYCLINSSKRILLLIMILMFGYNIFMRIRKSFNTIAMEEQAVLYLRFIIKIVVVCLFLLEFTIQLMSIIVILLNKNENQQLIQSDNDQQPQNWWSWSYMLNLLSEWRVIGSHFMIIVSLLFYDLLRVDNYVAEKRKFVKFSELKMKFSDLCEAQSTNEKKIYERVLIMIANDRLQAQIDEFLTNRDSSSKRLKLSASLNYHNMDIKEDLKNNRYEYLSKYVDNVKLMKIKATEAFFNGLLNHCNEYIQQDMLYLLSKVCHIDQGILETNSFNLTDYLSGDYNILENIYTQIVSFYANLFNKEDNEYTIYKAKIEVFEDNIQSFAKYGKYVESRRIGDTFDRKRDPDWINSPDFPMSPGFPGLRDSFGINSAVVVRKESTISRNTFMLMDDENTPSAICNMKRSERLKPAIQIFANELFKKRPLSTEQDIYNSRGSAKFKLPEENCSIIFHNIKRDSMAMTFGYTKLNPVELVKILICLIWSHIETIISLAIIFVLYLNGGMLSIIIIGILFFRILVEERGGPILYWELVNGIFFIQFVCKIFSSSFEQIKVKKMNAAIAWIAILGGINENNMATYDAFVQILIMWLIHHINKKNINLPKGKKLVTPGVAFARFIMGEKLTTPFMAEINKERPKMKYAYEIVKRQKDKLDKNNLIAQDNYLEIFGKNIFEIHKMEQQFLQHFVKLIQITKNDIFKFTEDNMVNFYWRNFASYNRKVGIQLDKTLFKIFVVTIMAMLVCYPMISGSPYMIWEAFSSDEIKDDLYMPLMIIIAFGCVQIYYMQRLSNDTAGIIGKKYFINYLKKNELTVNNESVIFPIEKFKKVTRRIINLFRVFRPAKQDINDFKDNPMFKLYLVVCAFWVYLSYLVYGRFIWKGHFDQTILELHQIYLCNQRSTACHNDKAYINMKILYFLFLMWMLVLVYQIKLGSQVWASSIMDFTPYNSLRFSIYGGIPFLREIMVVLSFATNKTALGLTQWFTIEDIKNTMTKAKFLVKNREAEKFGEAMSAVSKTMFKIAIFIVALLVVVGPMLPFSNLIERSDEYPIVGASVSIDILTNRGLSLARLFNSQLILKTDTIDRHDPQWKFLEQTDLRNRTEVNMLKYVRMSRFSQTYYEYTANKDLDSNITKLLTGGHIKIDIEFRTEEEGKYQKSKKIVINSAHAEEIKTVMETNCKSIKLNREMFLENIPMVYQLDNNFELKEIEEPSVQKFVKKKWSLGIECSYHNSTYFFISNEKEKNLEFAIFTRSKKPTIDMARKIIGNNVSIIVLYLLLFYYVGLSMVRVNLFDKTTDIWYEEVPKPEVMFILIDGIEMARLQHDFLKEDMLYYFMIQLLRNPEDLKEMTGSMHKHRLEVFRKTNDIEKKETIKLSNKR